MSSYNIAFDINNKLECLNYYSIEEPDGDIYKFTNHCEIKPLGSFILDFINTNFENEKDFIKFVARYCFEDLLLKLKKDIRLNTNKYYKDEFLSIKEKTLLKLLLKIHERYVDDFIYYKDLFIRLTTKIIIDEETDKELQELSRVKDYTDSRSPEEIYIDFQSKFSSVFSNDADLRELNHKAQDLKLDFAMDDFYFFHKELPLNKSIPYSFMSDDYLNILFISLKQLLYINNEILIRKCANCNKYFIPKTMHDTKYCDEIFKGNKTCKEIGRELAFKERLDKNPLLKTYRTRYQTLSKQASEREHHEMYEYFKKEGPEMRKKYINDEITDEEFQNWINNTKVRKT